MAPHDFTCAPIVTKESLHTSPRVPRGCQGSRLNRHFPANPYQVGALPTLLVIGSLMCAVRFSNYVLMYSILSCKCSTVLLSNLYAMTSGATVWSVSFHHIHCTMTMCCSSLRWSSRPRSLSTSCLPFSPFFISGMSLSRMSGPLYPPSIPLYSSHPMKWLYVSRALPRWHHMYSSGSSRPLCLYLPLTGNAP